MNQETSSGGKSNPLYSEEFKHSVVDHWCHRGKTAGQAAQEFGVKVWNVRDWRRRYGPTAKPVDAPLPPTPEAMAREIQQLRQELARVTTQRDILKELWASFGGLNVRYRMIEELSQTHAVRDLCQLLGVTRSGYYAWRSGRVARISKAVPGCVIITHPPLAFRQHPGMQLSRNASRSTVPEGVPRSDTLTFEVGPGAGARNRLAFACVLGELSAMLLPQQPVTLTVEQIAALSRTLSATRHDINNQLSLIVAAVEVSRLKPEKVESMVASLAEQPPKIAGALQRFSAEFERALGITRP